MLCLYCRQPISPLRRLWDTRFCSSEHRDHVLARSARYLRDAEDLGGDDPWQEERKRATGQRTSALVFVILLAIVGAGTFVSSTPQTTPEERIAGKPAAKVGFGQRLSNLFGRTQSLVLAENSHAKELSGWRDLARGSDWAQEGSYIRPGRLRIWTKSESLANYDFQFVGQIERKSLNWAFRATDARNYYATKVTIAGSESTLVRYVVLNGAIRDRAELPLPIKLAANTDYSFRLSAQGSRFLTSIDGRIVSSWSDPRISRGGIGFFSEDGERSLLKSAALIERDSLASRVLSHFSILVVPDALALGRN